MPFLRIKEGKKLGERADGGGEIFVGGQNMCDLIEVRIEEGEVSVESVYLF